MPTPPMSFETMYLITVLGIAVVGSSVIQLILKKTEKRRSERVSRLTQFLPTEVEATQDSPTLGREQALEFIATRFALFRRILVPSFLLFCGLTATIPFLGKIPATFVTVILGSVTVLAGIALKPLLENLFSGLLISFTQPVRIGDIVEIDSHYGLVEDIGISHTLVKLWNWGRYLVPNSQLVTSKFLNYTIHDRHLWTRVTFWVAPNAPLSEVRRISLECCEELREKNGLNGDVGFWLVGESQTGVECWVAFWVDHPIKAWNLRTDLRIALAERLSQADIQSNRYSIDTLDRSPAQTTVSSP